MPYRRFERARDKGVDSKKVCVSADQKNFIDYLMDSMEVLGVLLVVCDDPFQFVDKHRKRRSKRGKDVSIRAAIEPHFLFYFFCFYAVNLERPRNIFFKCVPAELDRCGKYDSASRKRHKARSRFPYVDDYFCVLGRIGINDRAGNRLRFKLERGKRKARLLHNRCIRRDDRFRECGYHNVGMSRRSFERFYDFIIVGKVVRGERDMRFYFPSDCVCDFLVFHLRKLDEPQKAFFFGERSNDNPRTKHPGVLFFPRLEYFDERGLIFYFAFFDDAVRNIGFAECIEFRMSVKRQFQVFERPIRNIKADHGKPQEVCNFMDNEVSHFFIIYDIRFSEENGRVCAMGDYGILFDFPPVGDVVAGSGALREINR